MNPRPPALEADALPLGYRGGWKSAVHSISQRLVYVQPRKNNWQDKILISKQMSLCISVLLSRVLEKDRVHLHRKEWKKRLERQYSKFKANELVHQRSSKQSARKRPGALAKERMEKGFARQDPNFKARERAEKKLARQDPNFKAKELVYQCSSKQSARKRPGTLAKERMVKGLARQDPNFKARERAEKKLARQDPNFKAN